MSRADQIHLAAHAWHDKHSLFLCALEDGPECKAFMTSEGRHSPNNIPSLRSIGRGLPRLHLVQSALSESNHWADQPRLSSLLRQFGSIGWRPFTPNGWYSKSTIFAAVEEAGRAQTLCRHYLLGPLSDEAWP